MKTASNHGSVATTSKPEAAGKAANAEYTGPAIYPIGRAHELLQGSGRHKWDDTGSRGFQVDQR